MLTVCTWFWGDKFNASDVAKLQAGVSRNLKAEHQFVAITDQPRKLQCGAWPIVDADRALLAIKGCFARLRMFDPNWQRAHGIVHGDRLACIDLDTVITGPLDPLFDRYESFVIMQDGNASNPCRFNGALQLLRAGWHREVWDDFSIEAASRVPFYAFPDDQGWLWHKLPTAAGWKCGRESGVYVFQKPGWPGGTALPDGARLVTFINKTPRDIEHLDWVKRNWAA
jgi:hypothetical protein